MLPNLDLVGWSIRNPPPMNIIPPLKCHWVTPTTDATTTTGRHHDNMTRNRKRAIHIGNFCYTKVNLLIMDLLLHNFCGYIRTTRRFQLAPSLTSQLLTSQLFLTLLTSSPPCSAPIWQSVGHGVANAKVCCPPTTRTL